MIVYSCAVSAVGVTLTGLSHGSMIVIMKGSVKVPTVVGSRVWKTRYLIGYDPFLDTNSVYRLDNLKAPEVVLSSRNMTESSDV